MHRFARDHRSLAIERIQNGIKRRCITRHERFEQDLPTLVDLSLDLRQHLSGILKILLRPDRRAYGRVSSSPLQRNRFLFVNQVVKDRWRCYVVQLLLQADVFAIHVDDHGDVMSIESVQQGRDAMVDFQLPLFGV